MIFASGDLLERLCYPTEFEIEGWKKIVPLTKIITEYSDVPLSIMKLELNEFYAIKPDAQLEDFDGKTIKDSSIFDHFNGENGNQKVAIYVSHQMPINEKYSTLIGNHCVVAIGLERFNGVDYLVLENTSKNKADNYIRLDSPFFESVHKKIAETKNRYKFNPDKQNRALNDYGFDLAQKKWKKLENMTATSFKNKYGSEWFNMKKDGELEYQMFFVKGSMPIYTLQFTKS